MNVTLRARYMCYYLGIKFGSPKRSGIHVPLDYGEWVIWFRRGY